jgi:hypothetical protein
MRFSPRTHIVDVWCCARCTACRDTADIRSWARTYGHYVPGKPYFHQTSHSSCFPWFRVFLVELGLIKGFSQIWRTQIFQSFRRRLSTKVSFNSHNAHCYFLCTACLFYVSIKLAYFKLSQFVLIAHELCHFEKNVVLNMLTKWDL